MAKTEKKATKATKATTEATEKKTRVKRTPEELAIFKAEKLAKLEERKLKLFATEEKLKASLGTVEERLAKKAEKDAAKQAKKDARELKKLEKREFRAQTILQREAERQAKLAAKANKGSDIAEHGFKTGPDGKLSIGAFCVQRLQESDCTVEQLQEALLAYYGPSEKNEQWKRTVTTYFNSLKSSFPTALKLAKKGFIALYFDTDKTMKVRPITEKERSKIVGNVDAYKLEKAQEKAEKLQKAQETIAKLAELRSKEVAPVAEVDATPAS